MDVVSEIKDCINYADGSFGIFSRGSGAAERVFVNFCGKYDYNALITALDNFSKVVPGSHNAVSLYDNIQPVCESSTAVALRASTAVANVASDSATCLANGFCKVPGFTPYDVASFTNGEIALGALAAVAAGSAAVYGAYSLYNYMNQPEPTVEAKPEPVVVELTVKDKLPAKPVVSALELNLEILNRAEKALLTQALGSVEVSKIQSAIDTTRDILKNIASEKDVDPVEVKKLVDVIKSELAAVSYEGKGVIEADKADVSYLKRAVIAVTEALQYVLSFLGQFMSREDKNPVAEALIGRSFFVSAPMTAREVDAVEKAQADVLDTVAVLSPSA